MSRVHGFLQLGTLCLLGSLLHCAPSRADREREVTQNVKTYITVQLSALNQAARDLQAAAPAPDGWNVAQDAAAVSNMRQAWRRTRDNYERIEAAIAVLFPDIDVSIDDRYHGSTIDQPETNAFDGQGFTGMHAIERILWAEQLPEHVVAFESHLPGYIPAAFPSNMEQAKEFREGLAQRLIDDTARMQHDFEPLALDSAAAFRGVMASMREQAEKVNLAATAEEESRYSRQTLADMRKNLEGGREIFELFRSWLVQDKQEPLARDIEARFAKLQAYYDGIQGDAIPSVPVTWNPDAPSMEDLATPYGRLRTTVEEQASGMQSDSLVSLMGKAADAMGIPELPTQ